MPVIHTNKVIDKDHPLAGRIIFGAKRPGSSEKPSTEPKQESESSSRTNPSQGMDDALAPSVREAVLKLRPGTESPDQEGDTDE